MSYTKSEGLKTDKTITLKVDGSTRPVKDVLKKAGYTWSPDQQCWCRKINRYWADQIQTGDGDTRLAALKEMAAVHPGCRIRMKVIGVDGWYVLHSDGWQVLSNDEAITPADATSAVRPGLDYCDAAGNYVGGKRITGSAPDDLV